MSFNIAINGYGRIGQCIVRALYSRPQHERPFRVVAINELTDLETLTYLTRYDTTHGRFPLAVENDGQHLIIDGDRILPLNQPDPTLLPWGELDVDLVLECSGSFCDRNTAQQHLDAGRIDKAGHGVVVGRQHGDLAARRFHRGELRNGNAAWFGHGKAAGSQ